jgi:hypothetical protein
MLAVYRAAMAFSDWLEPVPRKAPQVAFVVDPLDRASPSIRRDIAEGNGKFTGADGCRCFDIARGSASGLGLRLRLRLRSRTSGAFGKG